MLIVLLLGTDIPSIHFRHCKCVVGRDLTSVNLYDMLAVQQCVFFQENGVN